MSDSLESSRGGRFWPGFRQESVACLGRWLTMGSSGAVVGLAGAGKSNLLQYIAHYPERLNNQSQARFTALVPIDLNHLVDRRPATLYRLILRACHHLRFRFVAPLPALIEELYEAYKRSDDLFLAQTAVYDLLVAVAQYRGQVVLILDQFDGFCRAAAPELTLGLRGLRDSFKESLVYIVGMRQAVMYMPEPELLGDLYPLLDTHICWVGDMHPDDAKQFIVQEARRAGQQLPSEDEALLLELTGGYPALLKAACAWWLEMGSERPSASQWRHLLGQHPTIRSRLSSIWQGLTQEEQWLLANLPGVFQPNETGRSTAVLASLGYRGMCQQIGVGWQINGGLLHDFVQTAVQRGLGRIWQDGRTGVLFQGSQRLVGLRPLEEALLAYLVKHPYKPHTKSELIRQVWPEGTQIEGVTDDSLYQVVRRLRQVIEPETAVVPVYLLTKRGVDEGGYQFFPEGNPAN